MLEIRKLSTLTFDEALEIWNKGFEGYIYEQKMTLDQFIQRFGTEGLSPELSLCAFVNGEPAGILLNGFRTINGEKVGWNGGTGVAVKFRRTGVGKAMVAASLALYEEYEVDVATLEAAKANVNAINLYEQNGYKIVDNLLFLENKASLFDKGTAFDHRKSYQIRTELARDAMTLLILQDRVPWQTHWQSLRRDGELLVLSEEGVDVGYFLYKKQLNSEGKPAAIILFSAGIKAGREDEVDIAKSGLRNLFSPIDEEIHRATFNFPSANRAIVSELERLGFAPVTEQVFMIRQMK